MGAVLRAPVFPSALALLWAGILIFPEASQPAPARGRKEIVYGRRAAAGEVLVRFRPDRSGEIQPEPHDPDVDRTGQIGSGRWRIVHSATRSASALIAALQA